MGRLRKWASHHLGSGGQASTDSPFGICFHRLFRGGGASVCTRTRGWCRLRVRHTNNPLHAGWKRYTSAPHPSPRRLGSACRPCDRYARGSVGGQHPDVVPCFQYSTELLPCQTFNADKRLRIVVHRFRDLRRQSKANIFRHYFHFLYITEATADEKFDHLINEYLGGRSA